MFAAVRVILTRPGASEGRPKEVMSIEGYLYEVPSSA